MAPGAFHNSAERYDPPKCHPQTRVAVIQAIIDWIEDGQKTSFIMWLNGPAGAGKSAIAQEIAELFHKSGRLAASFFWSRYAAGRNNEERLIASLAYQLLIAIPPMRAYVEEALEADHSIFTRSLEAQMESLIVEPLEKVFFHGQQDFINSEDPKLIVLDGLDECGTPNIQGYILTVISHSVRKFRITLCFIIASRPEQAIRDSFNNQPLLDITTRLTLDETYSPDDDIRLFLVESFESVKRTHILRSHLPCDWPSENAIDVLVHKSSGQFIYAATVVKFVKSARRRPSERLDIILGITATGDDTPFAELDSLYCHIFSLVEDLPRATEVLSILLLVNDKTDLNMGEIETFLSYPPGDLQIILIDLHSVIDVPADGNDESCPHVLHASLQDFLMDSTRSRDFYLDESQAHERIARHCLRHINIGSPTTNKCTRVAHMDLEYHCSRSSATRELLADFFDFDFRGWVVKLIECNTFEDNDWLEDDDPCIQMFNLYFGFQSKEANVENYFGLGKSLSDHHSHSMAVAEDLMWNELCRLEFTLGDSITPEAAKNLATATTHPQIRQILNEGDFYDTFEWVIGTYIPSNFLIADEMFAEFQKFLLDPERAERYFVDSRMYTTLSVDIFKYIFETNLDYGKIQEEDDVDGKLEDDNGISEDDGWDKKYRALYCLFSSHSSRLRSTFILKNKGHIFAIKTLPFYLSNANYTAELTTLASHMFDCKKEPKGYELCSEMSLLREAVSLYLKKEPATSNAPQEQFHEPSTPENRLVDLEPEEIIDIVVNSSEQRFRAGKRRRNSEESFEVADSMASPQTPPPSRRLRIMDLLNT
ncbi:hypothetical protein GALMADRAFT_258674 [Galerina marginata CBS 339.88]|uniref:Nephrocystin 3-like N-terminal domain-containing protein n=1 Tax=Galerina marginata (strain CBS 339.88) TaxID=685588 RepID=A0A067S813_GALM3|nr:hypothetical protein GALMADRAFT_258674 [Galerina marginata CBS 339.88]